MGHFFYTTKIAIWIDETKIIFSPPAQNLVVAGEHTVSRSRWLVKKEKKNLVELDLHNYVITYNCIVVNCFLLGVNF